MILTKSDQLDQSFSFSKFSSFDDLIPSVIDIIFEYCDRFGDKLEMPNDLIQSLIEFSLSLQSNQSTYPLPLISFVFSKGIVVSFATSAKQRNLYRSRFEYFLSIFNSFNFIF